MKIKKIILKNYRNYDNLEIDFSDNLNILTMQPKQSELFSLNLTQRKIWQKSLAE